MGENVLGKHVTTANNVKDQFISINGLMIVWDPSTDMDQAMMCVEKMLSDSYNFWLEKNRTTNPTKRHLYHAYFQNSHGDTVHVPGTAAPLAICRAIVKAKGVKV